LINLAREMDKKAPPPAQTFPISLQQWQNDYSKRPTQQQLMDLTNEKNQLQTQLTYTQNLISNDYSQRPSLQTFNNLKTELEKEKT
jgi:hypothetical protein